jgi:hypothetical protein
MSEEQRETLPPDEPTDGPTDEQAYGAPAWTGFPERPVAQAFGLGALVGFVLLGLIWVTVSAVTDDPAPAVDRAGRMGLLDGGGPAAAGRPSRPTPMQRCADAADALSVSLNAARPALNQWEVHVGAMNQLVVGAISLQQATAFWNQTRVGAKAHIAEFHRVDRSARRLDGTCPTRGPLTGTSTALRACVRQVRADLRAVEVARTAVGTWEMHVRDMERLRSGKLSPAAATSMWLAMWQRGTRELHAFRVASGAARHQTGCRTVAG